MKFDIYREYTEQIKEDYIVVEYDLNSSQDIEKAAWDLAIGQSVGNPNVRNEWETDELFEKHSAIILTENKKLKGCKSGVVEIGFPIVNTDWSQDGIAHLLCQIMGGQMDIDHIKRCRAMNLHIPKSVREKFLKPKYGISGMRKFTGQYDKPFLGGIIKPKTGVSPQILLEMIKQMVDGGIDFIKEDEILSNPSFCSLKERVPLISNYLANCGRNIVYCFCINSDPSYIEPRAKFIAQEGGNGVHINIWSGLGSYRTIRNLDLPIYIHYQKSGDKVITHKNNPYSISWKILCQLAALVGVDTIHAGMYGGYLDDDMNELTEVIDTLHNENVVPALSCGMHPGLVNYVTEHVGNDYLANVGGAIQGHPGGSERGAKAMRQAIDKTFDREYFAAIEKWGLKQNES